MSVTNLQLKLKGREAKVRCRDRVKCSCEQPLLHGQGWRRFRPRRGGHRRACLAVDATTAMANQIRAAQATGLRQSARDLQGRLEEHPRSCSCGTERAQQPRRASEAEFCLFVFWWRGLINSKGAKFFLGGASTTGQAASSAARPPKTTGLPLAQAPTGPRPSVSTTYYWPASC
jgi:hypothetical protein